MTLPSRFAGLCLCLLVALAACGDQGPADPTATLDLGDAQKGEGPTELDLQFQKHLKEGFFTVCKVVDGSPEIFTFNIDAVGPGVTRAPLYLPEVELGNLECADVYQAPSGVGIGPDQVTITEVLPAGWQVDRVFIWNIEEQPDLTFETTWHQYPAGTTSISGSIDAGKVGCVAIFYNSEIPDKPGECTRTPGYWKTHPEAWPADEITIGGITYTKDAAIDLLWVAEEGDKSKTLFRALVAAKLNQMVGTDTSCVDSELSDADAWMTAHPVCSNVRGSSAAWGDGENGEVLYTTLDDYNNGRLCAPKCEDEDDDDEGPKARGRRVRR